MDGLTDKAVRIKKAACTFEWEVQAAFGLVGRFLWMIGVWVIFCLCKQFLRAAGCRLLFMRYAVDAAIRGVAANCSLSRGRGLGGGLLGVLANLSAGGNPKEWVWRRYAMLCR
ncbi:hypothetical protein [Kingella denitrificans]